MTVTTIINYQISPAGFRRAAVMNDDGEMLIKKTAAEGKRIEVYLDGELLDLCVIADERLGFVRMLATDKDGLVALDPKTGITKTSDIFGQVEIRII